MPDSQPLSESTQVPKLFIGERLDFLKPGDKTTMLSAAKANEVVAVANALLNIRIVRKPAGLDTNGNPIPPYGIPKMSDQNLVIELYDGQSTGTSAFYNTDQSFTASCPAGTTGSNVTVTVAANTIGSMTSVAAANALALELATDRANQRLSCTFTTVAGFDDITWSIEKTLTGHIVVGGQYVKAFGVLRTGLVMINPDQTLHPSAWLCDETVGYPMIVCPSSTSGFFAYSGATFVAAQGLTPNSGLYAYSPVGGVLKCKEDGTYDSGFTFTGITDTSGNPIQTTGVCAQDPSDNRCIIGISSGGSFHYDGNAVSHHFKISDSGSMISNYAWQDNSGTASITGPFIAVPPARAIIFSGNGDQHILADFLPTASRMKYSGTLVGSRFFARLNSAGVMQTFNDAGTGFSSIPNAFGIQATSGVPFQFIFVGIGLTYNGNAATSILATDSTGNYTSSFNPAITLSGGAVITGCAVDSSNRIYIFGGFSTANGHNVGSIFRLTSTGAYDTTFVPPSTIAGGMAAQIYQVYIDGGTSPIYLVGDFTSLGGKTRNHFAALTSSGTLL